MIKRLLILACAALLAGCVYAPYPYYGYGAYPGYYGYPYGVAYAGPTVAVGVGGGYGWRGGGWGWGGWGRGWH